MMGPYDEYDPETGESRAQVWQRQHRERAAAANYVPANPPARRGPITIDQPPAWVTQAQPLDVAQAWQAQQGPKETTSAVDRAKGLQMRLAPFVGLYALAGVAVGAVVWLVAGSVPGAALLAVVTFAALGILTYRRMNLDDYDHSGAGVERLRISEAAQLQREQMTNDQELKKMALESYLRQIEGRNR